MVYLVVGVTTKTLNIPLIFPVSVHFLLLRFVALEISTLRTGHSSIGATSGYP
jgi:hypothetical protein